jgi:hypothetical protein
MKTVKLNGKGVYLPGNFKGRVKFKPVQYKEEGFKGRSVIWEFELLESNLGAEHPVGCTRSQVVNLDKSPYAHADNTQITMALMGIDPKTAPSSVANPALYEEVTDTFCEMLEAARNSAAGVESLTDGLEAILETQTYFTKPTPQAPNGEARARYVWHPTPEAKAERDAEVAGKQAA